MAGFHDYTIKSIDGADQPLAEYSGKAVLVVNVASECGLTPQYAGLQALHEEFSASGFTVLGLPCNQFGAQEPGSEADIKNFCTTKFDVSFPMSSKIEVNGDNRHPLYAWLVGETGGEDISWNFEKFLVDGSGQKVTRFSPKTTPEDSALRDAIKQAVNS